MNLLVNFTEALLRPLCLRILLCRAWHILGYFPKGLMSRKNLSELINVLPNQRIIGNPDTSVQGIAYDSRQVVKNFIFVAIKGQHLDGARFVPDAVKKGASVVLVEEAA